MKRQKDIFDLFRDNSHKLEERPSSQAWRKLEQRLEERHRRRRPFFFRPLSMAAAVAMLVVLVSLISLLSPQESNKELAKADRINRLPEVIEDLPTYTDAIDGVQQVVEFQRKHRSRLANPVAEGDYSKRLVVHRDGSNPASRLEDLSEAEQQFNIWQFRWLLGQWEGQAAAGQQMESWQQKDRFTLEGQAYLQRDGEQFLLENMYIKKIGPDLFYLLAIDSSGRQVQYKLTAQDTQLSIFENNSVDFPQQVLIKRRSANAYSTILQNASPSKLSKPQLDFWSKRNDIRAQGAERALSRVNEN
ncbi:MAG: hypothetical protein AAGG75_18685 [Bacteroidota bacterium]